MGLVLGGFVCGFSRFVDLTWKFLVDGLRGGLDAICGCLWLL